MSRLRPLFLSFLAWLFEDEAYAYIHSGKPINRRRIFHNALLLHIFCWVALVAPFMASIGVFWVMANVPYATLTVIVFAVVVTILWASWKVEVHHDTRGEVSDVDKTMIGM